MEFRSYLGKCLEISINSLEKISKYVTVQGNIRDLHKLIFYIFMNNSNIIKTLQGSVWEKKVILLMKQFISECLGFGMLIQKQIIYNLPNLTDILDASIIQVTLYRIYIYI